MKRLIINAFMTLLTLLFFFSMFIAGSLMDSPAPMDELCGPLGVWFCVMILSGLGMYVIDAIGGRNK